MELAEKDELIEDLHLLVQAAFFGQIADALEALAMKGLAEEDDLARVGHGDADHHADGTGFPGAVGAQEANIVRARSGRLRLLTAIFDS